jgi:hypothetical protein
LLTGGGTGNFDGSGVYEAFANSTLVFDSAAVVLNIDGTGELTSGTWRAIGGNSAITINNAPSTINTIGAGAAVELRESGSSFAVTGTGIDSSLTTNNGSLTVGGTRVLTTSGNLSNTGSVLVDGAPAVIIVQGTYDQSGASSETRLNDGQLSATQFDFTDGLLTGNGTLTGDATFGPMSTIAVGDSPGIIDLNGTVEFDGTFDVDLASDMVEGAPQDPSIVNRGDDPLLIGFDQLNVFGNADLDGTMFVSLEGGFTPAVGDTFDVMTADSLAVAPTFSVVGSGFYTYDYAVLTLFDPMSGFDRDVLRLNVVTAIPEPGSLVLLAGMATLVAVRRRRRLA